MIVWEAAHPHPRLGVWWEAAQALGFHYRRATVAILKG